MISNRITRRVALGQGAAAMLALSPAVRLLAQDTSRRFKIGACDWSIGQQYDIRALQVAQQMGLDGVQVSFGKEGIRYDLRKPEVQTEYQDACRALGQEIASLGMAELNVRPYASDPDAPRWVAECVDAMKQMQQRIVLLAFFSQGDIKNKPEAQAAVIRHLKEVAPRAEQAGVILGIESWLSADEHLRILDAVGSSAVQVYYDVANMDHMGYDIYREIRQLGRERICQIHAKENASLLGQGKVDFERVKEALDDIQWSGWLVIEAATVSGKSLEECYRANQQYLRGVFHA